MKTIFTLRAALLLASFTTLWPPMRQLNSRLPTMRRSIISGASFFNTIRRRTFSGKVGSART